MTLGPAWRKSSRSTSGACVEARLAAGAVEIRDSKNRARAVLRVPPAVWSTFLLGVRENRLRGRPPTC